MGKDYTHYDASVEGALIDCVAVVKIVQSVANVPKDELLLGMAMRLGLGLENSTFVAFVDIPGSFEVDQLHQADKIFSHIPG